MEQLSLFDDKHYLSLVEFEKVFNKYWLNSYLVNTNIFNWEEDFNLRLIVMEKYGFIAESKTINKFKRKLKNRVYEEYDFMLTEEWKIKMKLLDEKYKKYMKNRGEF